MGTTPSSALAPAGSDAATDRPQLLRDETDAGGGSITRYPTPDAPHEPSQRRALFEGTWLALGYTAHGKLDDACAVVRLALPRLANVPSPRSVALLTTLTHDLRRRKRHERVAELLPDLESALAGSRP
jgi:hypothetical protein